MTIKVNAALKAVISKDKSPVLNRRRGGAAKTSYVLGCCSTKNLYNLQSEDGILTALYKLRNVYTRYDYSVQPPVRLPSKVLGLCGSNIIAYVTRRDIIRILQKYGFQQIGTYRGQAVKIMQLK